jgi:pimeloyl-ACP methyl ester carboxylesterase
MKKWMWIVPAILILIALSAAIVSCGSSLSELSAYDSTTSPARLSTYRGETVAFRGPGDEQLSLTYILPETASDGPDAGDSVAVGAADNDAPTPLVYLIHGLGASGRIWYRDPFTHGGELANMLLGRGYAIAFFDLPYHGAHRISAPDRNTAIFSDSHYDEFAREVTREMLLYQAYLRSIAGTDIGPEYVVGYSLGAALALVVADDLGVDAIVAAVPPLLSRVNGELTPWSNRSEPATPVLMLGAVADESVGDRSHYQEYLSDVPADETSLVWFESGHSLPAEWLDSAIEWLAAY